jgi:hypothetical protein
MTRREALACSVTIAYLGLLCSAASAQTPPLLPPPSAPLYALPAPPVPVVTAPSPDWGEKTACPWQADFLLGFPTGIRVQRVLPLGEEHPLVLEAFAGIYLIFPMATGGVRWNCATLHDGNNAITVAPGIDVGVWQDPFYHTGGWFSSNVRGGPLVSVDVDVVWRHHYCERLNGELGVKLGIGNFFSSSGWVPLPIAGIYSGFEF